MNRSSTNDLPALEHVLSLMTSEGDSRKLKQLSDKLECALGHPLSAQALDDPMIIRRCLVEHLRNEGTKPGTIQAMEQFFMGIIRRAAVKGLIPAPPEGPWTRAWQSVLDLAEKVPSTKALLRSLASWATARHIDPDNIENQHLETWVKNAIISETSLVSVKRVLSIWSPASLNSPLTSQSVLSNRLMKKAERGTVKERIESNRLRESKN
jgi:hypothetical protein